MTDAFDIDAMKRDMEAGTPGPWEYIESVSPDGQEWFGSGVADAKGAEFMWLEFSSENDIPLCRRIARVPEMEAEILRLRDALATIRKHGLQDAVDACHARADMITAFDMDCCEGTARNCADDITALMQEEPSHD